MIRHCRTVAFAVFAATVSFNLRADNSVFTWNGGTTGDWNDSSNWLCNNAATDRWPGKDFTDQNNTDEVQLNGVTATITLTGTTYVKKFVLSNRADITITSDGTKRSLFVYAGGLSVTDSTLTFDTVTVLHTTNTNEWGCSVGLPFTFNGDSTLILNAAVFRNGCVSADTCYRVRCYKSSTFWYRYTNGNIQSFDWVLDDSSFSGHADNTLLQAKSSSSVTFVGTKPSLTLYKKKCKIPGTLTLRYVLPVAPYANGPMQSNQACDFDNESGDVKIAIDESSPGLTSGKVQTYRLFKWDTNLANGIVLDKFDLPMLRTQDEVFTTAWKSGSAAPVPPQYLDVTIDGTYDPSNVKMEASFDEPASFRPNMRFAGTVRAMGVIGGTPAAKATLKLEYGLTDALGTETSLGEVTGEGPFGFDFADFDETSTYYYRLTLANDLGQSVSSEIGTCSHVCGTQLGSEVFATMFDGCGTVTGSVYVIGSGETVVKVMVGRNELEMFELASKAVDAIGEVGFDIVYPGEGKWYYKLVSSNSYGSQVWSSSSKSAFIEVSDANTYVWKGEDGQVNDPAKWTRTTGTGGIGYPTSQSTVVFPGGITSVVTVVESVDYAHVTFMQDDSDYTFVGDNKQFGVLDATCGGKNARLRLEGVKLNDPGYIWSGKAVFSCGDNCRIDLANGAQMVYRRFHLTGSNTVWTIGDGARCEVATGGLEGDGSELIVSNGYLYVGNPIRFDGRKITVLGEAPTLSITRMTCAGAAFDIELPETPYAAAPIVSGADMGNFANDKMTTINILKSPAARRKGGTYRILKWGLVSDSSKNAYGINTNNVVITGLRSGDSYTWSWEPGEEYESLGPQYLDIHYAKGGGLLLLVR